jgi:hypothetical protein
VDEQRIDSRAAAARGEYVALRIARERLGVDSRLGNCPSLVLGRRRDRLVRPLLDHWFRVELEQ